MTPRRPSYLTPGHRSTEVGVVPGSHIARGALFTLPVVLTLALAGAAAVAAVSPTAAHALAAPPAAAAPVSSASPAAAAQSPAASSTPAEEPMQEVVISGEHEGPRMWKVHKGDHVLWILGTVTPLPKKMIWQSDAVEAVLQQSQEVVPAWPAFGIGANPFTMLRVWIQWRSMQKSPDRMNLQQVLPQPLYARFAALKTRYA